MKLTDLLEFKIPLTIVSLAPWPNPMGTQHSGITNLKVDPTNGKVKLPKRKNRRVFFDKSIEAQTSGGKIKENKQMNVCEIFNQLNEDSAELVQKVKQSISSLDDATKLAVMSALEYGINAAKTNDPNFIKKYGTEIANTLTGQSTS